MKKKMMSLVVVVMIAIVLIACDSGSKDESGYSYTESGLAYNFYIENEDARMPEIGEVLSIRMTYGTDDSIFFNTDMAPEKVMKLPLNEPEYEGDLYEALGMMHVGDSAGFLIAADSFFLRTARFPQVPPFASEVENLTFNIKLENIQSEQEVTQEYEQKLQELQMQEDLDLEAYLLENEIEVEPTETGLIYINETQGGGQKPDVGDKVKVHYTGKLLDGTKFDSSVDRGQPFEFVLGQGQVIRGWDEGIALMREGGEATLIVPSDLGYGDRGAGQGQIPPYATLIFEVELLEVIEQ